MQSLYYWNQTSKTILYNHHHSQKKNGFYNIIRFRRRYFSGRTEDITEESAFERLVRLYVTRRYIPKQYTIDIERRFKYLMDYGVSTTQLNTVVTENVNLLEISMDKIEMIFPILLKLDYNGDEAFELLISSPRIYYLAPDTLCLLGDIFLSTKVLNKSDLITFILQYPTIFSLSCKRCIQPMLNFFMMDLRFDKKSMALLIKKRPKLFYLKIEKIRPLYQFLERYFKLNPAEMALVTARYPRIITLYGEVAIEPKFEFIKKYLDLNEKDMKGIFMKAVSITGFTQQSLEIKLKTLEELLKFNRKQLSILILKQPQILGYNTESMKKKVEFLNKNMGRSTEEVIECVTFLGYSLEGRILKRWNALQAACIEDGFFKLSTIFMVTDQRFNEFLKRWSDRFSTKKQKNSGNLL